ncbi:hypothetical protein EMIHUDRAFT_358846 [Emiliania huxleyi CCMP1516]|uniref:Uncharacterized protein n=2 Tax=Emiliania huxleyi TaxID=2903 RepID=A0A0D3IBL2_EMIH1|nr:hypothetical protein EMIHUDRAFT_358846 [Emiliania huxleyi CCMP1516]EOD08647.1 hypothetical protein EMIHUDRAFT_358846 [Emiliania huxleyi CCMP1516]|mmetsp:Transcript_5118/g.15604  ORF Transcript_5118/g.15604 Transcript_5118/m.15604 type:complete len:234 (-) Transcript_5118:306-1007(-)|eukprot:XP_005761076.1 hypothetical protein EMIHUDRAFT_358846 [Emiliania huxleyi CCMP1516]
MLLTRLRNKLRRRPAAPPDPFGQSWNEEAHAQVMLQRQRTGDEVLYRYRTSRMSLQSDVSLRAQTTSGDGVSLRTQLTGERKAVADEVPQKLAPIESAMCMPADASSPSNGSDACDLNGSDACDLAADDDTSERTSAILGSAKQRSMSATDSVDELDFTMSTMYDEALAESDVEEVEPPTVWGPLARRALSSFTGSLSLPQCLGPAAGTSATAAAEPTPQSGTPPGLRAAAAA